MRTAELAVGLIAGLLLAVALYSSAAAQGANMRISQLDCSSDPEFVVLENAGDAAQDLTGWRLESDPVASETFDLSAVGGLQAGASITIQSGPSAAGVFVWSQDFVFRDDDPADFARLVDSDGATVQELRCAEATPTPSPTATPEPTASPPAGVPNGGGPPPLSSDGLSPAWLLLIGGLAVVGGLAVMSLARVEKAPAAPGAAPPGGRPSGRPVRRGSVRTWALMGMAALALMFLVRRRRRRG